MAIKIFPKGSGERLSENFKAYEFDCRCDDCAETRIDTELVNMLQALRDRLTQERGEDTPIHINSGYRCEAHNAAVGGAKASYHMCAVNGAADIRVPGVEPATVAKAAESVGFRGIGLYDTFVHVDPRPVKFFWYGHQCEPRTTFGGAQEAEEKAEATYVPISLELPVLHKGDRGDTVEALQTLLFGYGYVVGASGADGIFGEATENAVTCFQEYNDLTADGIVGAQTWAKLLGL